MNQLTEINLFGEVTKYLNKINISESQELSTRIDARIIVDGASGKNITLAYTDNDDGVKVEIFAFCDMTVTYYTDSSHTTQFSMANGTSMQFIFHNGWKHNGIYDAVWN